MNIIFLIIFTLLFFMVAKKESTKFPIHIPIILVSVYYYLFIYMQNQPLIGGGGTGVPQSTMYTDLPDF